MKKLIISLLILIGMSSPVRANYDLFWRYLPAICGTFDEVQRYIKDRDGDITVSSVGLGRSQSHPDGDVVFMVTLYNSADGTQETATVQIPDNEEVCMVYHIFNKTEVKEK